jgi:radical SAM-linked protein
VSRDYLLREREVAHSAEPTFTPDCRREGCLDCGVCTGELRPRLAREEAIEEPPPKVASRAPGRENQAPGRRLRIHYARLGPARYLGHLELVRLMYRAFRRAAVPVAYSQGFHPLPKLSFGKALPVGVESLAEYVDVELAPQVGAAELPAASVARALGAVLPEGLKVQGAEEAPPGRKMAPPTEETYIVGADGLGLARERVAEFLERKSFEVELEGRKGPRRIDLRSQVLKLEFVDETSLKVALSLQSLQTAGGQVRPEVLVRLVFGLSEEQAGRLTVLKVS